MKREISYQTVDLSGVCDRSSLHDRLQESLTLPSWYGRNLDALYDALTDGPGPMYVRFTAWKGMEEADPAYFKMFRSVLRDIVTELPGSSFLFEEEGAAEGAEEAGPEEALEIEEAEEASEEAESEGEASEEAESEGENPEEAGSEEEEEGSAPGYGEDGDSSFFRT